MSQAAGTSNARKRPGPVRMLLFSLLPAIALLAALEVGARLLSSAEPALRSLPLPAETEGLFQPDDELFWSFKPHLETTYLGVPVYTNAIGMRGQTSGEGVAAKPARELRVLSLGESTTFGSGVSASATYTAVLERAMARPGRPVRAFNAGVPAYSSYQSLRLLETRGLALEPDLVLFYHELNDYLPSSLRDASNTEIGVLQTDRQLDRARHSPWLRLANASALVRTLQLAVARARVERFDATDYRNPLLEIGMPDIGLPPRLVREADAGPVAGAVPESALGRRVSDPERLEILDRLIALAQEHGFELVIFHPAYQISRPHECLLTVYAGERGIALFDVQPLLHPPGSSPADFYRDAFHPNARGHQRIGAALAGWLRNGGSSLPAH